ncbi:MAG: hypothetical protein GY951_05395 [Psychromonas sp.]|nr:hypothetical protein [Alteromonadales bacterium]MCP5077475.1 hypothetical protein [Psychromonas sp.]
MSLRTSTAYKISMFVFFLAVVTLKLALIHSMYSDNGTLDQLENDLSSLLDTIFYILLCHFILRSYIKLKVNNHPVTIRLLVNLLFVLLSVSLINAEFVVWLHSFDYFSNSNGSEFVLVNDQGDVDAKVDKQLTWWLMTFNAFVAYLFWIFVYIAWHLQSSRKEMQKQMHQVQLQQLTNQLSPHFLFNSLNSIRALIYEDKDKAADTVTQLSELFRTHLQAHLKPKSSLDEEWQICHRYLSLEKIRLEERLILNVDIDKNLNNQRLPTLTLLTLIENAIKHGISPSRRGGFINIQAKATSNQKWCLTICNSVDGLSTQEGTNTGLVNVQKRLQYMFAEDHIFKKSTTNNEFTILMELPLA